MTPAVLEVEFREESDSDVEVVSDVCATSSEVLPEDEPHSAKRKLKEDSSRTVKRPQPANNAAVYENRERLLRKELEEMEKKIEEKLNEMRGAQKVLDKMIINRDHLKTMIKKTEMKRRSTVAEQDLSWLKPLKEMAKYYFNITKFREHQLEVCTTLLGGVDACLVMPTGGGKSLCFTLPVLVQSRLAVVISPLVSLMTDQVNQLRSRGIAAAMISAQSTREEQSAVRNAMKELAQPKHCNGRSDLRLIYVTPERIAKSKKFMSQLEKVHTARRLGLIAVDEVHCVSQWGHSFRQDYQHLTVLKKHFKGVPILGLTATATEDVIGDAQETLQIEACPVFKSHVNRPNLFYEVRFKPKLPEQAISAIAKLILTEFAPSDAGIIYCLSRKDAMSVTQSLKNDHKLPVAFYHGEMDHDSRKQVHHAWMTGKIRIVVATVAFGMGIHRDDVRFVIHHSLPKSLDNFYQESGRAGRDGRASRCIVFYRPNDIQRHSTMVYWEHTGLSLLYDAVRFCTSSECRRKLICEHYDDDVVPCDGMCDQCAKDCNVRYELKGSMATAMTQLCALFESRRGDEGRRTILQMATEWRRTLKGVLATVAFEKPLPGNSSGTSRQVMDLQPDLETLQAVLANLLADGWLTEEFYHTPYSTNSYLQLKAAERIKGGEVPSAERLFKGSPLVYELLLPTGAYQTNSERFNAKIQDTHPSPQSLSNVSADPEAHRQLLEWRLKIANSLEVFPNCIFTDNEGPSLSSAFGGAGSIEEFLENETVQEIWPEAKRQLYKESLRTIFPDTLDVDSAVASSGE